MGAAAAPVASWLVPTIAGVAGSALGALGSGKGGSSDVDYKWSDEEQLNWQQAQPWVQQKVAQGMMGPPQMGPGPSLYDIPDATGLTPTSNWFNSIAPEVRQGLWEPWNEAANQLQMNMQANGQLGNPRGGYSGAAGTGLGKLYADAGQQVGMQAWNMMQPGQQALWQANLGKNITGYNTSLIPWQNNYQSSMQDWTTSQGLLNSMATRTPTGIISQQGNPWAGAASGATTGLLTGLSMYNMFGNNNSYSPYGYSPYTSGTPNYTGMPVDQWQYSY